MAEKWFPTVPTFNSPEEERQHRKQRLAAGFRLFAKFGFEEGVAGHITARDPIEPETFWVNPFAVPFAHNAASCRVLEKAGYVLEARLRRSAVKNGVGVDQMQYAFIVPADPPQGEIPS